MTTELASKIGITIWAVAIGLLLHYGCLSWAAGLFAAGLISEIRER
jgi:hypothetical protein